MRKLLMITTALVALGITVPQPAKADPITAAITASLGGGAFGGVVARALVQLALSAVLGAVAQKLAGKPRVEQQRAELARPTSLPSYRFVYGTCWAPGTPVGWKIVRGDLYICYLLNSRPSALTTHSVLLDKRSTTISGNPFDFDGAGASVTNAPFAGHARYWIGRGDQVKCPDAIVSGSGYFAATDAWRGRTVLWAHFKAGNQNDRAKRWPATPPELNVEGDWSLIHDPRDDSYRASSNQALIVRDALMQNPLRPYLPAYLWDETFAWAADVADDPVTVKAGGTIPRYRANGVLVWADGAELEDQIGPLLAAGGARLIRSGGRLGILPAVARPSVHAITDLTDGQNLQMTRWQPSDAIYTECVATYTAPDRAYEAAEAPAYVVAGAQAADGGLAKRLDLQLDFVTDGRQAQRLAKIEVLRSRMQRTVAGELFPDAFVLVSGSVATLALPAPYGPWNGLYEVESINPAAGINDDDSITLRLPVSLRETSPAIYAWEAATEEQEIEGASFDGTVASVSPPASVTLSSGGGAALIPANGAPVPRVEVAWTASAGASAVRYEWQYASETLIGPNDDPYLGWGGWIEGGTIEATDSPTQRAWIGSVMVDTRYRARVRTIGSYGASDWVEGAPVTATGPTRVVGLPVIMMAAGGAGQIDLTLRQASDGQATQIEIWAGAVDAVASAALLATLPAGANVTVSRSETGLGAAETRFYWLRARDALGNASAYTASATATTL